jgi:hypothetical protein
MKKLMLFSAVAILLLAKGVFSLQEPQPSHPEKNQPIATTATHQAPAVQGVLADQDSTTFDEKKFAALGFPPPQSPNPVQLDPKGLERWKQYGVAAAVKAAQLTGVDAGIIGFWSFYEGVNYDYAYNNCVNTSVSINEPCGSNNWQTGNFAAQPANAAAYLQEAFDKMYGGHDDATVQKVGQAVVDAVPQRDPGQKITYPSTTFPKTSLQALINGFNSGDLASRAWVSNLARDDALGAYIQAKVFKAQGLDAGFADSMLYDGGVYYNKQKIVNTIQAVYDAGLSGGGPLEGSTFSLSLTVKPKVNDTYVINVATADVIGAATGGAPGIPGTATDATGFLKAGQDIMQAYVKCEPPGLTFDQPGLDNCLQTYLSGAGYSSTQVSAFISRRGSSLVGHSGPTGSGQCTECLGYIGITAALWGGTADAGQTLGDIPTAGAVNDRYSSSGFTLGGKQYKPVGNGPSAKVIPGDIAVAGSAGCGCDHIAIVFKVLDDTHVDLLESNGGYDCKISNTRGYPVPKDSYTFYRQQ